MKCPCLELTFHFPSNPTPHEIAITAKVWDLQFSCHSVSIRHISTLCVVWRISVTTVISPVLEVKLPGVLMIRIHLLMYFLALGFVLLGYSSQLHHVICFTWLRATLHCAAQFGLSAFLWEYLPPFDLIFLIISSRDVCSSTFSPPHIF